MAAPAPVKTRDRSLSDAELREVWQAADAVGWPWAPVVKLLVLTAQRRNEVVEMRRAEVDLDRALWTIPAERSKNKRAHEVPLTGTAVALLHSVWNTDASEAPPRTPTGGRRGVPKSAPSTAKNPTATPCPFVFSTTGKTAVSGLSKAKRAVDAAILEARRKDTPAGTVADDVKPMPHWTFHDLRRTATTGMARLGVHPHIADAVLNHKTGAIQGVAAVYNRHAYTDERRRALETWERHVVSLLAGSDRASNVVRLNSKAEHRTATPSRRPFQRDASRDDVAADPAK